MAAGFTFVALIPRNLRDAASVRAGATAVGCAAVAPALVAVHCRAAMHTAALPRPLAAPIVLVRSKDRNNEPVSRQKNIRKNGE